MMMDLFKVYFSADEEDDEEDHVKGSIISNTSSNSPRGTKRCLGELTWSSTSSCGNLLEPEILQQKCTAHESCETCSEGTIKSSIGAGNCFRESLVDKAVLFDRTVPHIQGNWAGHVYAQPDPLSSESLRMEFQKLESQIKKRLQSFQQEIIMSLHTDTPESMHISLSKLFFLQHPSITHFERLLTERLEVERTATLSFRPHQLEILLNDSHTRTFVTCPAVAGSVMHLIHAVDDVLVKLQQPRYYAKPNIHISILSVKGNQELLLRKCIEQCRFTGDDEEEHTISLNHVYCTLGKVKKIIIPLKN